MVLGKKTNSPRARHHPFYENIWNVHLGLYVTFVFEICECEMYGDIAYKKAYPTNLLILEHLGIPIHHIVTLYLFLQT